MTIHNVLIFPECDFVVDHFPITFTTPLLVDKSPKYLKCIRSTRSFNFDNWCSFISNYVPASDDVSSLYRDFSDSAATYLDLHCPRRVVKSRTLSAPWFDAELKSLRTSRRKAEHAFLKNRTDLSLFAYPSARTLYRSALQRKHRLYYTDLLSSCSTTKQLFDASNTLLHRRQVNYKLPSFSCAKELSNRFIDFESKISSITASFPPDRNTVIEFPAATSVFESFHSVTADDPEKTISSMNLTETDADVIPTKHFSNRTFLSAIIPFLINNTSLSSGVFPSIKQATVVPLLKKPNADPEDLAKYRPLSHLSFISKLFEKVVAAQLVNYLTVNNLLPKFQSGFRKNHSIETAITGIHNDILFVLDKRKAASLLLLDLTAAFDTVSHILLIRTLKQLGLRGNVFNWFSSYLCNREECIKINNCRSRIRIVLCGVPQGSTLGPILFTIYTISISFYLDCLNIPYHLYADDTQLYLCIDINDCESKLSDINLLILDIKTFLKRLHLDLNADKTEILFINPSSPDGRSVKTLGCILSNDKLLSKLIDSVIQRCNLTLRELWQIRNYLSIHTSRTLINSLITCHLDLFNGCLSAFPDYQITKLQKLQNGCARLIFRLPKHLHITPFIHQLHWLKLSYRITFKVCLLVWKCFHGLAPEYLTELLKYSSSGLRSQSSKLLTAERFCLDNTRGAFALVGPRLYNRLPLEVREAGSLDGFKTKLKTHLFQLQLDS